MCTYIMIIYFLIGFRLKNIPKTILEYLKPYKYPKRILDQLIKNKKKDHYSKRKAIKINKKTNKRIIKNYSKKYKN